MFPASFEMSCSGAAHISASSSQAVADCLSIFSISIDAVPFLLLSVSLYLASQEEDHVDRASGN